MMEKYCHMGVNVLYHRNSVGNHLEETGYSALAAMQWLAAVLAGPHIVQHPTARCTFQNVTERHEPRILGLSDVLYSPRKENR